MKYKLVAKKTIASVALLTSMPLLAGCSTFEYLTSQANMSDTGKSVVTPTQVAPSSIPTGSSALEGAKLTHTCEDLYSVDELYTFNPNFSINTSQPPLQPQISDEIASLAGVTCTYMNLSSGDTIQLSVAKLKQNSVALLQKQIEAVSAKNLDFSTEKRKVFFELSNGNGLLQILKDDYWIVVTSPLFQSPEEAMKFIEPGLIALTH